MSSKEQKPQVVTQTQDKSPWAPATPYLMKGMEAAQGILNKPQEYYQGNTVAGFTDPQVAAQEQILGIAGQPAEGINAGYDTITSAARGDFVAPNPFLANAVRAAIEPVTQQYQTQIMPGIDARFSGSGRLGGALRNVAEDTAEQNYLGTVGNVAGNMAYANYNDQMGRMLGAAQAAPQSYMSLFAPATVQSQVGREQQAMEQAKLSEAQNRWNFQQQAPVMAAQQYMDLITKASSPYGSTVGSTVTPTYSNPWMTGLGVAGSLAGIGGSLFGRNGMIPGVQKLLA